MPKGKGVKEVTYGRTYGERGPYRLQPYRAER